MLPTTPTSLEKTPVLSRLVPSDARLKTVGWAATRDRFAHPLSGLVLAPLAPLVALAACGARIRAAGWANSYAPGAP